MEKLAIATTALFLIRSSGVTQGIPLPLTASAPYVDLLIETALIIAASALTVKAAKWSAPHFWPLVKKRLEPTDHNTLGELADRVGVLESQLNGSQQPTAQAPQPSPTVEQPQPPTSKGQQLQPGKANVAEALGLQGGKQ